MKERKFIGVGRRKTSVARVYLLKGDGKIIINKKPIEEFFCSATSRMIVTQPLSVISSKEKFDIIVTVSGGGNSGQSGAIRHGITRALVEFEKSIKLHQQTTQWKKVLRKSGFMTRDPRCVERKKVGLRKARKSVQFSKR